LPVIYGAPEGQDARIMAEKARKLMSQDKVLVHIALDDTRISVLKESLSFFASDVEVLSLPAWDCLPYDRVSPNSEIVAERASVLCELLRWSREKVRRPKILLLTVNAALQKVTPRSALADAGFSVSKGGRLKQDELFSYLSSNGYIRTETVREPGEFAVRGGIIDLFPAGHEQPVRLDLFGDEIESIKHFDPIDQRSQNSIDHFSLTPATEFFLNDETVSRFRSEYREFFGTVGGADPLYAAVSEHRRYNGMDHWMPLFFEEMQTVFDYLDGYELTQDHHSLQAQYERIDQIKDFYLTRKNLDEANKGKSAKDIAGKGLVYHPLPPECLYITETLSVGEILSPFRSPEEDKDSEGATKAKNFIEERSNPEMDLLKSLAEYISHLRSNNLKVLISAYSEGSRGRLRAMMERSGFANLKDCNNIKDCKALTTRDTGLIILGLESGFVASDIAVISEQDILGDRLTRTTKTRKRKSDNFVREVSSLHEGDLVIHSEHGLGRFMGLETLEAAGLKHDCAKLVYEGGDKLFVPIENIEVLSKYGSDDEAVSLDKLGGAGWQSRKAKVKKDLLRIAEHLMKIAAARELKKGEALSVDNEVYNRFAATFPYAETDDQNKAIADVVEDMASGRPMDRLVCGDVGFGKTEVALRAAYVAAMDGAQVALIAPTTLLVRQHYMNFVERFKNTGLKIAQLSRFVTPRAAKATREGMAKGEVNIVIGTHALLAKDVKFDHLGLMIIDEEQRFGVKQKERLKELRENVHILTLTATPIPRTLQMSLTGVKDMSIIATPPVDRMAIRTFVLPFDPMVIREAILREHYRGGQSFYVCPRIKDLEQVEETLRELVPEVSIVVAHGQMSSTELEDKMNAFVDKEYDVLIATNIIESGLDIPTANTMIVHRAEMFGLAQLYQIRGRIGRSKVRAYAYLTYEPNKMLTEQAQKRLEVLETLDTLGAGFQLASHDMDIRGAGNLLGEEQSGHVKEVGVELYQQMLEDAVAAARAGVDFDDVELGEGQWSPNINLGTSILIPERYVSDLSTRMSLYRRLAELETESEVEGFAAELIDRFGKLPDEVENLLEIVKIKQLCKAACVDRVDVGPKGATIGFYKDKPLKPEKLIEWMATKHGTVKLRPDQRIFVMRGWSSTQQRITGSKSLLNELAAL